MNTCCSWRLVKGSSYDPIYFCAILFKKLFRMPPPPTQPQDFENGCDY